MDGRADGELGSILSRRKDRKAKQSREGGGGGGGGQEDRGIYVCRYRTLRYAMNV